MKIDKEESNFLISLKKIACVKKLMFKNCNTSKKNWIGIFAICYSVKNSMEKKCNQKPLWEKTRIKAIKKGRRVRCYCNFFLNILSLFFLSFFLS